MSASGSACPPGARPPTNPETRGPTSGRLIARPGDQFSHPELACAASRGTRNPPHLWNGAFYLESEPFRARFPFLDTDFHDQNCAAAHTSLDGCRALEYF